MLRWKIIIGGKPRGLWRPELKLQFWNDAAEEARGLNINPIFELNELEWADPEYRQCGNCRLCKPAFPVRLYQEPNPRSETLACPGKAINFLSGGEIKGYAEWRPGTPPDYNDYYKRLREYICIPAVTEYTRRIEEASASPALDEIVFSDDDNTISRQEDTVSASRPARKIKI